MGLPAVKVTVLSNWSGGAIESFFTTPPLALTADCDWRRDVERLCARHRGITNAPTPITNRSTNAEESPAMRAVGPPTAAVDSDEELPPEKVVPPRRLPPLLGLDEGVPEALKVLDGVANIVEDEDEESVPEDACISPCTFCTIDSADSRSKSAGRAQSAAHSS